MAKRKIDNYKFYKGIGINGNLYPNAWSLLTQNKTFIEKEVTAWIGAQVAANATGFEGYTYDSSKCERDTGYNIDAYAHDLRYGGNAETYRIASTYWEKDVAQVDGTRQAEIKAKEFTRDLINNHVFNNSAQTTPYQTDVAQVIDNSKTSESGTGSRIQVLVGYVVSVLTTGLSALPTWERKGSGHVRFIKGYDTSDVLLVTNTTQNQIIYNFADPLAGGNVTQYRDTTPRDSSGYVIKYDQNDANEDGDPDYKDFQKYLQTTDAITTIDLIFDTSSYADTDELQIFVEEKEIRTRPFDFGTDAIERMRIAQPLSMLDADFEYGLQPTKWSAIGTMRGYPSVYELPGTDTQVLSVVTDASAGTNGIGASLITVTTQGAHGFEPGTPITIKALEDAVGGAARGEGSFIITTVPTATSFTYYAKSKVGTTNGQVLSTTYTQLRQGAFYTGAAIGLPNFSVLSDGTNGTMTLALTAQQNENKLAFTGDVPEIGAPIDNAAFPTGTQVTAISGTPGGTALQPATLTDISIGSTQFDVASTTGIIAGQAANNGTGDAIFVTNIVGSTVTMSGQFTAALNRLQQSYTGVTGTNVAAAGSNGQFDINKDGTSYVLASVSQAGSGYNIGDRIKILGTSLGGLTPANDAIVLVSTINGTGGITAATITGTALSGTITYQNVTATNNNDGGTMTTTVTITHENDAYTLMDLDSPDDSSGFAIHDRVKVPGTQVDNTGQDGAQSAGGNDIIAKVTSVGGGGSITGLTVDNTDWSQGTPPSITRSYEFGGAGLSFTGGSGTGFEFRITVTGTTYGFQIVQGGSSYTTSDTIVCAGSNMGGASPANDVKLQVVDIGAGGTILDVRVEGVDISSTPVAFNGGTIAGKNIQSVVGASAIFDVTNNGTYSVAIDTAGSSYHVDQTFTIAGTELGGSSPANDATVTVTSVAAGAIDGVSIAGTAPTLPTSFTGIAGANEANSGSGAQWDITRNGSAYSVITLTVGQGGSAYYVGNKITILGTSLGGASPANDAVVTIASIGGSNDAVTGTITGTAVGGDTLSLVSGVTLSDFTTQTISSSSSVDFKALATLEVTWPYAHGMVPGDTFLVDVNSDDGGTNNHALAAGSFIAITVPEKNKITYNARSEGSIAEFLGDSTEDKIQASVYMRPDSFFIHRPYDGGVQLGTGGPQHGAQAIRQSKKYIRYQSGKGIMYTTGALFAPSYDLRSVTANGTAIGSIITVTTDDNDHGAQIGGKVRLIGVETAGYNGEYIITQIVDERTYKCAATRRLGATTALLGFAAQMTVVGWHGATVRSGIFDDQNGIYWEFDGTNVTVAQRTSTKQVAGTFAVQPDSNLITGTNTRFRDQLKAGDRIVVKGMTHVVSHVESDTVMTVTPDYRGVNPVLAAKAMLIADKKVQQQDWNLDRLDGTGPSGYDLDVRYMQMIGIQYSWYGAGFIDWMVRGSDGNFVYCHRMRNSNVNTEAYMRSGNLPVRYEVTNEGAIDKLKTAMDQSQVTMELRDSSFFPDAGTVYVDNELIAFSSNNKTTNTLSGLTRAAPLTNYQAGAVRQYTAGPATAHAISTGVILVSNTITPLISHWGSAFITDGNFDEDRGYIFSYAETGVSVSTTKQTAFLLRLAPSVSNAIVGDLGDRELLNRAQLLMQTMEITSEPNESGQSGGIVVEGVLNPQNYPVNPADIGWSGLSGLAQGGQPSFAQIASGGSVSWNSGDTATYTTAAVMAQASTTAQLQYSTGRRNYGYFNATSFETANIQVGDEISDSHFPGGTTLTQVTDYGSYYFVRFSTSATQNLNSGQNITFVKGGNTTNSNFVFFTKSVFDGSGAKSGTDLGDSGGSPTNQGDINFPANTAISYVEGPFQFGDQGGSGIEYYKVFFNNSASGTVSPGDVFNFTFSQPPYAQPGETVFSFIAVPGEQAVLDLNQLKELTNTTLGGRGTFPNGPDVLAINVYKTTGNAVTSNIIIKWGEAQA